MSSCRFEVTKSALRSTSCLGTSWPRLSTSSTATGYITTIAFAHQCERVSSGKRTRCARSEVSWIEGYRENWALLDGSAWEAPFLADQVFLDLAAEVPLPDTYRSLNGTPAQ
jgi:hypothetical protein